MEPFTAAASFLAANAGTIASVASAGGTLMQASAMSNAGKAQEIQAKQQAEMEGIRATEEAIQRRERLIQALASQNARVGASGSSGVGANQIMLEDMRQFEREDFAQDTLTKIRQKNMKAAGQRAGTSGRTQAGISLLTGASNWYEAHGKPNA